MGIYFVLSSLIRTFVSGSLTHEPLFYLYWLRKMMCLYLNLA